MSCIAGVHVTLTIVVGIER